MARKQRKHYIMDRCLQWIAVYSIMLLVPVFWPYKSARACQLKMFFWCTLG